MTHISKRFNSKLNAFGQKLLFKKSAVQLPQPLRDIDVEDYRNGVDAGTIAKGSSEKAFEGRHYYRCMRVNKEMLDALIQYRMEQISQHC